MRAPLHNDSCRKFLLGEAEDQQMYHWWDTGRISQPLKKDPKTSSMKVDDATASQLLRDCCGAHLDTLFVDAADDAISTSPQGASGS
jgi:hypothetical protein